MKLFKPYVNLTKSSVTEIYTLNAVINLPFGYTVESITQEERGKSGKKVWGVNLNIKLNGTPADGFNTQLGEFSIELDKGPQTDMQKICLRVIQQETNTLLSNPPQRNSTDIDYGDAEEDLI